MAERKKRATLCCSVCGARNYTFAKGKATERAERMKYCPQCRQHTLHRESK